MFTVGYITYICNIKLDDSFILGQLFPERYESLKRGLTEGVTVPGMPPGFKVYEKEAIIVGIVLMMQAVTSIPRTLATVLIFQKFAEWAGSNQTRIKQLRVGCVVYYIYANLCVFYGMYEFIKSKVRSSETVRLFWFYNTIKSMRDMSKNELAYDVILAQTMEAENYKEDFDLIWNLDDEIFNQIDVESTEDIKSQIHRLQNAIAVKNQEE